MELIRKHKAVAVTFAVTYSSAILLFFTYFNILAFGQTQSYVTPSIWGSASLNGLVIYIFAAMIALLFKSRTLLLLLSGLTLLAIPIVSYYLSGYYLGPMPLAPHNPVFYAVFLLLAIPAPVILLGWFRLLSRGRLKTHRPAFCLLGSIGGGICGVFCIMLVFYGLMICGGAGFLPGLIFGGLD